MVVVIGQFRIPPQTMATARPLMSKVMLATRAEAGCVEYNYAEDVLDPGLIRVSEVWESRDQLLAHLRTAHMATWAQERSPLGLSGRAITIYEVSGSQVL